MNSENEDTDVVEIVDFDEDRTVETEVPSSVNAAAEELKQAKSDYLYLAAEFENYKKNAIRERSELLKYGSERMAREFLNVLDNFERALATETTPENLAAFRQGIQMTATEFRSALQKFGIEEVPALGKPFDPVIHEAIGSEETTEFEPGFISRVLKSAFKIQDRILRPAQVIVAKAPAKSEG